MPWNGNLSRQCFAWQSKITPPFLFQGYNWCQIIFSQWWISFWLRSTGHLLLLWSLALLRTQGPQRTRKTVGKTPMCGELDLQVCFAGFCGTRTPATYSPNNQPPATQKPPPTATGLSTKSHYPELMDSVGLVIAQYLGKLSKPPNRLRVI